MIRVSLTSGDDFAQALSGSGAVPAPITKLMLALFGRQLGTFDDLLEYFGFLPTYLHLSAAQPFTPVVVQRQRTAFQVLWPTLTAESHRFHHRLAGTGPSVG